MGEHTTIAANETTTPSTNQKVKPWNIFQKIGFRFTFTFFMLFIIPFPFSYIPYSNYVFKYYYQFIEFISKQIGSVFFGITEKMPTTPTGSGDTLYYFVNLGAFFLIAVVVSIIWSVLDRKRVAYRILNKWLLLLVSFYLLAFMMSYGISKVFYLQFSPPSLERLFQSYGHSSPMRLMWTFMGASKTYTVFAGVSEVVAAFFLIFRRTRVLGGLITFGVMFNVFMMNMSYDIPVKLFSFQLMIMGLFVALVDYKRLMNMLLLNKNTLPNSVHQPIFQKQRSTWILLGVQILFVGYLTYIHIDSRLKSQKRFGALRPKPALYGIYNVDKFVKNGQEVPPLTTDTTRWNRLLFDYVGRASVMMMDDSYRRYVVKTDTVKKQITFNTRKDTVNKYVMKYEQTSKDLKLKGVLKKDTLNITFKHYPLKNFSLFNRGFHWVSPVPYNRYKDKR